MQPRPYLDKVTTFITRSDTTGARLLLIRHPTAGIQIPGGTVEPNEPPEQAALREAYEETGLGDLTLLRSIGWRDELPPNSTHVVYHGAAVYSRPDSTSFDWARLPRGIAVRLLREQGSYAQITYEEGDRYPDPNYLSYAITGWVPWEALALTNRRHFFHLACAAATPPQWSHFGDSHLLEPFWAPLDHLPEIIAPQRAWLDYVTQTVGYRLTG